MNLGLRLRRARMAAKLTQDAAAHGLSVSKGSISAWENNRNRPMLDQFVAICALYQASPDELLLPDISASAVREGGAPYDATAPLFTSREKTLLAKFRALPPARQAGLLDLLGGE